MLYVSPFANQKSPQKPINSGDESKSTSSETPTNDLMSHRDRFLSNFQKFAPQSAPLPATPSLPAASSTRLNSSGTSTGSPHLAFLYDKAQGTVAEPKPMVGSSDAGTSGMCSKFLTDPGAALGYNQKNADRLEKPKFAPPSPLLDSSLPKETQFVPYEKQPAEDGSARGSVNSRAAPATPDFLNSCSSRTSPFSPKPASTTESGSVSSWISSPSSNPESETGWSKSPEPTNSMATTDKQECSKNSSASSDCGKPADAAKDAANVEEGEMPSRPSFESARRHWVYSPQMFPDRAEQSNTEKNVEKERKRHPGARSRPIPDYLNFRKYSVPLVSLRPKVEVEQKAVDDQSPQKQPEMRSIQKASSEIDSSSVHQLLREGDEISLHHQKSIRYTGRTNPSKVFQLLQSATGMEAENIAAKPPPRRRVRKPCPESEGKNEDADDIVDISYVGGNIPSRTFQCLKYAFDDRDSKDPYSSTEMLDPPANEPGRSIKVIHLRPRKSIDEGTTAF